MIISRVPHATERMLRTSSSKNYPSPRAQSSCNQMTNRKMGWRSQEAIQVSSKLFESISIQYKCE